MEWLPSDNEKLVNWHTLDMEARQTHDTEPNTQKKLT